MIPITASLASVESMRELPSSSSWGEEGTGKTRELRMQEPIAKAKGAS